MDKTNILVESLKQIILGAPSAICTDEFNLTEVRIDDLSEAFNTLQHLVEDERKEIIDYQRAVLQVTTADDEKKISLVVRGNEADIILSRDILNKEWLCEEHRIAYEQEFSDQEKQFEISSWQRFSMMMDLEACSKCRINSWVEITLDKGYLESQFKKRISYDLPHLADRLDEIHIFFWADLAHFYSHLDNDLIQTHNTISKWGMPCLLICEKNAENNGSDYFKSISTDECKRREMIEATIQNLMSASSLQSISSSRQNQLQENSEIINYLPPEYWLNANILSQAFTGEAIPNWFCNIASLFVYDMLTTVSSKVVVDQNSLRYEIVREFELNLECSISEDIVTIIQDGESVKVRLSNEILRQLLNFFSASLQGKYTSINHDLVQRSIVYGTKFSFESFFSKLDLIKRFYEFEYKHLLGDRFDQQSRTLSTFISDMMGLRQQLASLIDSLSKDLSGLTITVLATTALAIVAKIIDIGNWDNLVLYGITTSIIFAYFYVTAFLLRIDNLKGLGERSVDDFIQDVGIGQKIWDFPLHSIGVDDKDLDRDKILFPLISQHKTNQYIVEATGVVAHILFLSLAIWMKLWWFPAPILIFDTLFLSGAILSKDHQINRLVYYSLIWIISLVFTGVIYSISYY